MLKILGRLFILLAVIALTITLMVVIVNNFPINQPFAGQEGRQRPLPEFSGGQGQNPQALPEFQRPPEGPGGEHHGGESYGAVELFKNLGIIAGIVAIIVIFREGIMRLKPAH
ncbi:MAG: hypothetical protein GYA15_00445 [Leptolinea sp.]|jgi:hypothetical protein|nr:hypothetical protein [Leptolinea sp.]